MLLQGARRLNFELLALGEGHVLGTVRRDGVLAAPHESNYLSGTAFAIRQELFPAGSAGNLFAPPVALVRDVLAECEGVVR